MKKNDIITLQINSITIGGDGVGRDENGFVFFVPNAAYGDVIEARILKPKKTYAFAKIEKIINPSSDRIHIDCTNFHRCGGCVFRHISYSSELKFKRQSVIDALERIAKIDDTLVTEIIGADDFMRYRNKAILPIKTNHKGETEIGFFKSRTHQVIDCDDCLLHPTLFNDIITILREWISLYRVSAYDEKTNKGILRHIFIRLAEETGNIMVCIVINSNKLPFQSQLIDMLLKSVNGIKSVMVNVNTEKTNVVLGEKSYLIYGEDFIQDVLCKMHFKISLHSFYQVNRRQTEKLYSTALECANLSKNDIVLDLYCGIGTIGIIFAKHVKKVIGVEVIEQSIENARQNAVLNNINNIEFVLADASWILSDALNKDINVVVVDPPRKGCSQQVIDGILKLSPEKVIYISCNPSTLARDLNALCQTDYVVRKVVPVDMFPRTGHTEVVSVLNRCNTN